MFPSDVGIIDIESYFPSYYVEQSELEKHDGVSAGKYTIGLGQKSMSFCSDLEDVNSLCLTVVKRLLERQNFATLPEKAIGRLEVGTESLLDKSKSVKTVLMQLFDNGCNYDVEGVDCLNACFGGTQALFNAINWIESSSWDGRLALVVMADIAAYAEGPARCTGGAGAVALLIGPNAVLTFDRGLRACHMRHVYDFYKPNPHCAYPVVDGRLSIDCYTDALDNSFALYRKKFFKKHGIFPRLDSFAGLLFHAPYCKLVQKSVARLYCREWLSGESAICEDESLSQFHKAYSERTQDSASHQVDDLVTLPDYKAVEKTFMLKSQSLFETRTAPSLFLAERVGNVYTSSLYAGLISLLINEPVDQLAGRRLLLFSYGSGSCSAMFSVTVNAKDGSNVLLSKLIDNLSNVYKHLKLRIKKTPADFVDWMKIREDCYGRKSYAPKGDIRDIQSNCYFLTEVDSEYRRRYTRKTDDSAEDSVMNGVIA